MAFSLYTLITVFTLLATVILLLTTFSIGVSQINDYYSSAVPSSQQVCSANKLISLATGQTYDFSRPIKFTYGAGYEYDCAWSTFSTSLRSSVTFIAAIFNLLFIYIVVYRKKFFQYLSIAWLALQSVGMIIIMGLDSNYVNIAYKNICVDTSFTCNMMPYITVCLLDAACMVVSVLSTYVMFKWTWTWMDESGPSGSDLTLATITTQQNEFATVNSNTTSPRRENAPSSSIAPTQSEDPGTQQSWFTGVGQKAYAYN